MKIKLFLLIGIVLTLISYSYAQTEHVNTNKRLEIGDALPDITFTNKSNFPSWLKSTNDLKGKLVLLDFWAIGCSVCVEGFPKMDSLQKEFGEKIQIIPINSSSEEKKCLEYISKLWDNKMKKAFGSLSSVNGDKRWGELFPHVGVPHHVWIDQEGKVIAITQAWNSIRGHIRAGLNGEQPKFTISDPLIEYDYHKMGIMRQGHNKLPAPTLYSSFLPPYNGLGGGTEIYIDSSEMSYRVTHRNLLAAQLYYLSNKKLRNIVETSRIPKTTEIEGNDKWQENNSFTYEIKVPLSEKQNIPQYMLEDLNRFFGMKYNIVGAIETRSVSAYVLKKVKSPNSEKSIKKMANFNSKLNPHTAHLTTYYLLKSHFRSFENIEQNRIFIDETGIGKKDKLDIYLPTDVSNLSEINIALKGYGFELVKETRQIELMVVKDK